MSDLLKRILIKHCPTNDVQQVCIGAAVKIGKESSVTGELDELLLNYIARTEVARRDDGSPK